MGTLYGGRQGETVDYTALAIHHQPYLTTTLKKVLSCIDDITSRDDSPLVCADFGTGDGGLAVKIFEAVKDHLSSKQDERELTFMLNDQEKSDFNKIMQTFINSSLWRDDKVSILFNCRNMYRRCFPTASLDIVLSSIATMVFDKPPMQLKGIIYPYSGTLAEKERDVFGKKLTADWCDFMKLRSAELKTGGYLVNYVLCLSDESKRYGSFPGGFDIMNDVWKTLCDDQRNESLSRVTFSAYTGVTQDYLAPFQDGVYSGLQLVSLEIVEGDVYRYPKKTGNETRDAEYLEEFAAKVTKHVKSWMYNGFKNVLPNGLSDTEKEELLDAYYERLQARISKGDLDDVCFEIAEIILKRI